MKPKFRHILISIAFSLIVCNAGTLRAEDPDIGNALCKGGCLPLDQPCIDGNCLEGQQSTVCAFCDDSTNSFPLYKTRSMTAQD